MGTASQMFEGPLENTCVFTGKWGRVGPARKRAAELLLGLVFVPCGFRKPSAVESPPSR